MLVSSVLNENVIPGIHSVTHLWQIFISFEWTRRWRKFWHRYCRSIMNFSRKRKWYSHSFHWHIWEDFPEEIRSMRSFMYVHRKSQGNTFNWFIRRQTSQRISCSTVYIIINNEDECVFNCYSHLKFVKSSSVTLWDVFIFFHLWRIEKFVWFVSKRYLLRCSK